MNTENQKVRRYLLKPLVRRPQRTMDQKAYMEALSRLDDRALGKEIYKQIRGILLSVKQDEREDNWKDPKIIADRVAFAQALYVSGRITTQEYVYFAVSPVECVHEGRMIDGNYKSELGPIIQAIRNVEAEYGLKSDEYWPKGEGPEEYNRLNAQFEAVLDLKFLETLREFGLHDLADLKQENPQEFERLRERGRRSVQHRTEYAPAIHDVVVRYEQDARRAAVAGAYSAAITTLGAGVEGLLLLRCLRSCQKAGRISKTLKKRLQPRNPDDPKTWTFETLIEVCLEAGWLPPVETSVAQYNPARLAHVLRMMRNNVHPGRHVRERPWSEADKREYMDAEAIYVILLSTLGKVKHKRAQQGPGSKI